MSLVYGATPCLSTAATAVMCTVELCILFAALQCCPYGYRFNCHYMPKQGKLVQRVRPWYCSRPNDSVRPGRLGVRSPVGTRDFLFSTSVQTGTHAHQWVGGGGGGCFRRGNFRQYIVDHPPLSSTNLSMGITQPVLHLLHLSAHVTGYWLAFIFDIVFKDLTTVGQIRNHCLVSAA
jgi:hypothetical protein